MQLDFMMPLPPIPNTLGCGCLICSLTWKPEHKGTLTYLEFNCPEALEGSGTKPGRVVYEEEANKTCELPQPAASSPSDPRLLRQVSATPPNRPRGGLFSKPGSN